MSDHSVYLYDETDKGFELYIGDCSTAKGLSFLPAEAGIRITGFGATCFREHGWATPAELPEMSSVADVISFLESEGEIGLVDFNAEVIGIGSISTHDDQECHFVTENKHQCNALLRLALPPEYENVLVSKLVSTPGIYMGLRADGTVAKYSSFDDYPKRRS